MKIIQGLLEYHQFVLRFGKSSLINAKTGEKGSAFLLKAEIFRKILLSQNYEVEYYSGQMD
jgi:hypothetical protein